MKRASIVTACALVAGLAIAPLGGVASASSGAPAGALPILTLALNGKAVAVGGGTVSGAVKVVTTVTNEAQGEPTLLRLNPGVTYQDFLNVAVPAVNSHNGDLNYLDPYGSITFDAVVNKGTHSAQTILRPGTYIALDIESNGPPPNTPFTVTPAARPAPLPTPGATIATIEFGFRGPTVLHDGELVRFENNGFLVHMDVAGRVKNAATGRKVIALLRAGKDGPARPLVGPGPTFAGPVSSGALQQEVITAKPGWYIQACFMNTQDGREHTQLGMERLIRIVK